MPATITIKVCSRSSVATEFPCNCEDSVQSENPKAASVLVFESAQVCSGECSSLALVCPGLIHLQTYVNQHGSQLSGPQPAPVNLARACLRVLLCPRACPYSACIFLPHQTFIFSDHHISCFSPSYWKSSFHFPQFVLLCTEILLTLVLFIHGERQCRTKRPMKLWGSLSKLLSRLWTHQVSEDNKTLSIWCLDRWGMRSCIMEAFDFISGSLLGSQLSLFYSPATPTSDFILKLSYFAHAGLLWLGRGPVYTNIHSTSFLGDLPVVAEISTPDLKNLSKALRRR